MYSETRPETLCLLIELDCKASPLTIDTEQFVKNTEIIEFETCEGDLVNLRTDAVDRRAATKFLRFRIQTVKKYSDWVR